MSELLWAFHWPIIAGLLGGVALSFVGSHLASRNQAVQTLVVSQAAALGLVLGLSLNVIWTGDHSHPHQNSWFPLLFSFLVSALFYFICEKVISFRWVSRNTYYVGIFGILMSLTYSVISLVPALDSHMAASYFGDITLASDIESMIVGGIGLLTILFFMRWDRAVLSQSFDMVLFGQTVRSKAERSVHFGFVFLSLLTVAASVQLLGLLFTLSCLFIPILVQARFRIANRSLLMRLMIGTVLGVMLGFIVSLTQGKLPTVPAISMALILTSLLAAFLFPRRSH